LPRFPIWDDVCTFDGKPWKGKVDVIAGGFPCTDISVAGRKWKQIPGNITGSRSGLWKEMARIVGEVLPKFVFVENTPTIVSGGLALVLGDLASMGYDARWGRLGADIAALPHHRSRFWLVAYPRGKYVERNSIKPIQGIKGLSWSEHGRRIEEIRKRPDKSECFYYGANDGVPNYVDRITALGNAQVPIVAATAFKILSNFSQQ
jgi:DNA (cytosine-5)-methyltransferase 1